MTAYLFKKALSLGCNSVHIGGGEPFLNPDALDDIVRIADNEKIKIEYIETNSSWYSDKNSAVKILRSLKNSGVNTILISISPFHNEHIPFYKTKGVIEACRETGLTVFPWVQEFIPDLNSFDEKYTHSLIEYQRKFGSDYVKNIPQRYWIHLGGRALKTFKKELPVISPEDILKFSKPCYELSDTSHFHFDLYGNYIPGLCSGLSIDAVDIGMPLMSGKYQIINVLHKKGIKGLYNFAKDDFGFEPEEAYLSKCHLCNDIRCYLVTKKRIDAGELAPVEYYNEL